LIKDCLHGDRAAVVAAARLMPESLPQQAIQLPADFGLKFSIWLGRLMKKPYGCRMPEWRSQPGFQAAST
jgi:hypothetical protein